MRRMADLDQHLTNVALTPEGGVWWEGMTDEPPVWSNTEASNNEQQQRTVF